MGAPIKTDLCCVEGCMSLRRPAGHGRSRFCYRHHHHHYVASNAEAMERKRENERRRTRRLKGLPEDLPIQDPLMNLKQNRP